MREIDALWVIVSAGLVFVMQPGFAMLESGLTRSKNSINVAVKNLTDFGVSVFLFWVAGAGIMYGASAAGLVGIDGFMPRLGGASAAAFFIFQAMFCSTSATIVSGAVAERMRFGSYIASTAVLSALIYPVFGHWAWGGAFEGQASGWLAKLGFVDFAGSTVVHSLGGWVSLAALIIIGPRIGRFPEGERPRPIPGSNIPMAVLGVLLLWFGWIGFNGGSTLAFDERVELIVANTVLAGAAGMIATLGVGWAIARKPDVGFVLNGALAGLVAITAPCHVVEPGQALVIGAAGGLVMLGAQALLERLRIDDAVGAIPVHLAAGAWGTLAVALFGDPARLGDGLSFLERLGVQALGVAACAAWSFGVAWLALKLIDSRSPLRVGADEEREGLNMAEHGVSTEIFDLYRAMDEQAETGDLSLRAPVEPFTEAGQIASRYNRVMENLERRTVERAAYVDILDNVSDGLFVLDEDLRIGPHYSKALPGILMRKDLAGADFMQILRSLLPEASWEPIERYLGHFLKDEASPRTLAEINPLKEVELRSDTGKGSFESKTVQFGFRRIKRFGASGRILVVARDVSEAKRLERELAETKEGMRGEMELYGSVLRVEPELLEEFLDTVEAGVEEATSIMEGGGGDLRACAAALSRIAHRIKGDADMLGLDAAAERAHALEDAIAALVEKRDVQAGDFLGVSMGLRALDELAERLRAVAGKAEEFWEGFAYGGDASGRDPLVRAVERLLERLSKRYGKPMSLEASGFDSSRVPEDKRRGLRDILVQLARNSVVHGVEAPEARARRGKPERGKIRLWMEGRDGALEIGYSDDGAGLDLEAIKRRAIESGRIGADEARAMKPVELVPLIFEPGFSTASAADLGAGRGTGMDLVREEVRKLGGKLSLRCKQGAFCEFLIRIPGAA
jgi:Amt family ammonium transporter